MPFKSEKQRKACYATKGFGGKVDCDEWNKHTKDKDLPERKMKEIAEAGSRKKRKR